MKQLICLDMDNTLVVSDRIHLEAFNRTFDANGIKRVSEKRLRKFLAMEVPVILEILFPKMPKKTIVKLWKDHNRFVVEETANYAKHIKGTQEALKQLKERYKLALVSNCTKAEIIAILRAAKIDKRLFDIVISDDDVRHGKPSPEGLILAKKITKTKEGFMIGDSIFDVRAGKAAGLRVIAVTTGNNSYKELAKEKPFLILKTIAEVPKALKGLDL